MQEVKYPIELLEKGAKGGAKFLKYFLASLFILIDLGAIISLTYAEYLLILVISDKQKYGNIGPMITLILLKIVCIWLLVICTRTACCFNQR